LPSSLGGTQVLLEGSTLPVYTVRNGCAVAQIPWGFSRDEGKFQLSVLGARSAAVSARIGRYAPAAFKFLDDGTPQVGRGTIYHAGADEETLAGIVLGDGKPGETLAIVWSGSGRRRPSPQVEHSPQEERCRMFRLPSQLQLVDLQHRYCRRAKLLNRAPHPPHPPLRLEHSLFVSTFPLEHRRGLMCR
jgi:uncharacterized protein (TIGR03437 family)